MKTIILNLMLVILIAAGLMTVQGQAADDFKITSPAFKQGEYIPKKFTCDFVDQSPELHISGVPKEARSLLLIVDDPDAPIGVFTHWVTFNIPPDIKIIEENSVPGIQGINDFRKVQYNGPCPPRGKPHRYRFTLYALDTKLDAKEGVRREELNHKMHGHVRAITTLTGLYEIDKQTL